MRQSDAAEYWPLIKAWSEGKTLQHVARDGWRDFDPDQEYIFAVSPCNFRIKPEPRTCYVYWSLDGQEMTASSLPNLTIHVNGKQCFPIKVREVLE